MISRVQTFDSLISQLIVPIPQRGIDWKRRMRAAGGLSLDEKTNSAENGCRLTIHVIFAQSKIH